VVNLTPAVKGFALKGYSMLVELVTSASLRMVGRVRLVKVLDMHLPGQQSEIHFFKAHYRIWGKSKLVLAIERVDHLH